MVSLAVALEGAAAGTQDLDDLRIKATNHLFGGRQGWVEFGQDMNIDKAAVSRNAIVSQQFGSDRDYALQQSIQRGRLGDQPWNILARGDPDTGLGVPLGGYQVFPGHESIPH
jgi:hypothetical protein